MITKPMRAVDVDLEKLVYPVAMLPKIDGVRGCNLFGQLTARTLEPHDNRMTTNAFSRQEFVGLDGEFAAELNTHPRLCSLTSSALSTQDGFPFTLWWLFDYVTNETCNKGYIERHRILSEYVNVLRRDNVPFADRLRVIPYVIVHNEERLLEVHGNWCAMGFEGSVFRKIDGVHKNGTSTMREGGYLRLKKFADDEGEVIGVIEGQTNLNPATTSKLGKAKRSTHKENMVPNGRVGTIVVKLLKDVVCNNGTKILEKGSVHNISKGKMTVEEQEYFFANQDKILGGIVKFQHFPTGVKDSLRMATFHSFRSKQDL